MSKATPWWLSGPALVLFTVLLLVPLGNFNLALLSTMRALVNGESLWSKARSQTATRLRERLLTP